MMGGSVKYQSIDDNYTKEMCDPQHDIDGSLLDEKPMDDKISHALLQQK